MTLVQYAQTEKETEIIKYHKKYSNQNSRSKKEKGKEAVFKDLPAETGRGASRCSGKYYAQRTREKRQEEETSAEVVTAR